MIASNSASEMRAGVRSNAGLPGRRSVADPSVPVGQCPVCCGVVCSGDRGERDSWCVGEDVVEDFALCGCEGLGQQDDFGIGDGAVGVFDACLRDVVDSVVCEGLCVGSCVAGESFEDCVGGWGVFDQC